MANTVKGRVGWAVVKRLLKAIPYIGPIVSVGFAGHEIKKKGLVRGAVHVGLDVTPVVGTAKNVVEIFTGDWIPDKPPVRAELVESSPQPSQIETQEREGGQVWKESPGPEGDPVPAQDGRH